MKRPQAGEIWEWSGLDPAIVLVLEVWDSPYRDDPNYAVATCKYLDRDSTDDLAWSTMNGACWRLLA